MALKREFLSTNEVAQVLGISPFTVRRYIQLRKLKAVKLEGSYRVRQSALDDFIHARELETEDELAAIDAENKDTGESPKDSPRSHIKSVEPTTKKSERPAPKQTQPEPRSSSKKSARVQRSRREK